MMEILANRSLICVKGRDALKFLQGIITNDLENHRNSYNYLLSPAGKYLYDFFVCKVTDEELFIDIDSSSFRSFLQKLNLYKLRKVVTLENLSDNYKVVYSKVPPELEEGIVITYRDPRFFKLGFRSIIKINHINDLILNSNNLYLKDKYAFTIPDGASDLIYDKSIPLHFGGEELSAISFTKGCYVGQEVISRAKYQGVIRKKIFKIKSEEAISFQEKGNSINNINGNKIGIFCSSYENLGIALVDEQEYENLAQKIGFIEGGNQVDIIVPEWR